MRPLRALAHARGSQRLGQEHARLGEARATWPGTLAAARRVAGWREESAAAAVVVVVAVAVAVAAAAAVQARVEQAMAAAAAVAEAAAAAAAAAAEVADAVAVADADADAGVAAEPVAAAAESALGQWAHHSQRDTVGIEEVGSSPPSSVGLARCASPCPVPQPMAWSSQLQTSCHISVLVHPLWAAVDQAASPLWSASHQPLAQLHPIQSCPGPSGGQSNS